MQNLAKGSCDLTRAEQEITFLSSLATPLSARLIYDQDGNQMLSAQ